MIFPFKNYYIYLFLLCACRSEGILQDLVLSFYHVGPKDWTQVVRFGSKSLYPHSHLDSRFYCLFFLMGRCWLGNGVGTQQCTRADVPVHHYPRVICVCSSALHSVTPPLCFWTDLLGSFQMLSHGPALDQLLNIYQYSTFLTVGEELGPVVVEVHLLTNQCN